MCGEPRGTSTSRSAAARCWALAALTALAAPGLAAAQQPGAPKPALARRIVSALKTTRGLALDIGCGDASLAIELARRTGLKIQCVEPDAATVQRAREAIDAAGLYGTRVAADTGSLAKLAYPSYCANLVVCGDEFVAGRRGRDLKEIFRVLNPDGVAFIGQSAAAAGKAKHLLSRDELTGWLKEAGITSYEPDETDGVWLRITRPRSAGWDEWTHRGHDPANTYASGDKLHAAELKLLWAGAPQPGLASAAILVAGGRLVEVGRGYGGHPLTTPYIQVSDAFTGIRLWAKVGRKQLGIDRPLLNYSPIRSCSDIAAAGDNLYVLGGKVCHVLDLRTGAERARFGIPEKARAAEEDIWLYLASVGDTLYGSIGPSPRHQLRGFTGWGGTHWRQISRAVFALDRPTGRPRWVRQASAATSSIVIAEGRLWFIDSDKALRCLDAGSGDVMWTKKTDIPARARITHAACHRGRLWVMYSPSGKTDSRTRDAGWKLAVFSAEDGSLLHRPALKHPVASMSLSEGTVFLSPQHAKGQIYALDAATAAVTGEMLSGPSGSKCTPVLATPKWVFYRHQAGSGFVRIDRRTRQRFTYDRIRCSCHYPGLPANGLLYVQGPGCNCAHPFRAHVALIPGKRAVSSPADAKDRLVRGEAHGRPLGEKDEGAWPTWRADCTRSGQTAGSPPGVLRPAWKRELPGRPTAVAAGGGLVFCGSTDRKLYAVDAASGAVRWAHIASGPVRVTPHLWRGRIYFGDDDGWVNCLGAEDGKVIWRFRAALGDERIVGYGEIMSAWPAGNGVLVRDGKAYCTAGFFPGEGGMLYALDAATGEALWTQRRLDRRRQADCTFGAMAMGDTVLFMPTVGGAPLGVHLDDADRKRYFNLSWQGAFSPRGHLVMTLGDAVIAGSPHLQYIHHVTTYYDLRKALPVVTDEAIYLRDGRALTAEKRSAYKVHRKRGELTYVKSALPKRVQPSPEASDLLWRAWRGVTMSAAIKAGGTIFTGGEGKVYATAAADGRELWSEPVPGTVTDLAFAGGRLFAVTDAGAIVCFAPSR